MRERSNGLLEGCATMSKRMKRSTRRVMLPETAIADRNVIQLLREERIVVHFHQDETLDDMFVKAPDKREIIHEFPVLRAQDGGEWQRTTIDPLTLKRALQQHAFRLEDEADTPFSDGSG